MLNILAIVTILSFFNPTEVSLYERIKRQAFDEETPVVFPAMEEIPEVKCIAYDGGKGFCRPAGLCVFRFESAQDLEESACTINKNQVGTCCPGKPPPSRASGPLRPEIPANMPDISSSDLDFAGQEGRSIVQRIDQLEIELQRRGLIVRKDNPEYFLDAQFDGNKKKVWELGRDGLTGVEATLKLVKTFQLSSMQSKERLRHISLANTVIADTCPKSSPCPTTKYRTSDGSCNNLLHPEWGKSFQTYSRILPPRYADGINEARASYDGGPLPSAREVSQRVFYPLDRPSRKITTAFTLWAQFLGYDLSLTGVTHAGSGDGILCCHPEIQNNQKLLHPQCMPIHVPDNDPLYKEYNVTCMQFLRSVAAPRSDCTFGPREQLNQVTAYIDGSSIYGSSDNITKTLRSFEGGNLKWTVIAGELMLPRSRALPCARVETPCFATGDKRSNQNILLSVMHGLMLREHNRLADLLSKLNPGWNDEILFHEARRLLCAEIQHITYSEFLPLLLGNRVMSAYELTPKLTGYSFDYDQDLNAGITNSFASAANRFGHTLVQSSVEMYTAQAARYNSSLSHSYDPSILYEKGSFDALVRGMILQPAQSFDHHVVQELSGRLFSMGGHGLDLIALNIQRGRDHGLSGYNEWREYCGLPRLRNFEDLLTVMNPTAARNFSRLYRNVDDVDLYPAGSAETPLPDSILGPTFACIIAEQFRRLKLGDRFWYENGGKESSFNEAQLKEIRKVTLSRLFCDNTNVKEVQLVSFVKPANWNPFEDCSKGKLPKMNLSAWKNEPVWT
ncbi:salivary peroxidase/catechol oxidase-like isoform X1 [Parasteatoda tepidariorum]|uniref:salivary peroxidase/catechol oxidase-like isoform X1 n=1 Tax=Parasteatoda tepidariorum TaxID=114398 RepID=UPI0039BD3115